MIDLTEGRQRRRNIHLANTDPIVLDGQTHVLALNEALEKQISEQSVAWHNPQSGNRGSVTPIRTFKSATGEWCREYAYDVPAASGTETLHAVACRAPEGRWQNRVPALVES
ncbi:MAG: hypothetical protein EXQ98_07485 [Alphaproteobacteria bacterium]|nr:hypothetical protein [Alphaproteobacteria bacterium]